MRLSLSLTQRYLLFLAAVIAAFIVGSQLITSRVVRSGLEEMFRQRFNRAQVVLDQYDTVHRLAKSTELASVLNSPRFIAALETEDSATIGNEMPIYRRVLDAELLVIADRSGNIVYATGSSLPSTQRQVQAIFQSQPGGISRQYVQTAGQILELLISHVTNGSDMRVGWIAEGSRLSSTLPNDLKRLTGFDVMVSYGGQVLGTTESPLMTSLISQPNRLSQLSSGGRQMTEFSFGAQELVYSSFASPESPVVITFISSLDEHINPIKRQITIYLVLFAIGGGVVSMVAIYLFTSRRIGRQVNLLVSAAEQIAAGKLEFPIQAKSKDELGYLAGEFEKMRNHLVDSRHQVEVAHTSALAAERLAAIGKLATGIIHDFKNPMAVIRGTVDLIRAGDKENEKLSRYCATIHDQVDRMVDLTRDVLDYSRGQSSLAMSEVPLAEYFNSIQDFHAGPFRLAAIDLTVEGPSDLILRLDPNRFRRVIDNILNNAREALKPGDLVLLTWSLLSNRVAITINDNGPGIPEGIRETLFDPFVTSNKAGGTGLGLAIAKKIVDDHGGLIKVQSSPGNGTRFVIDLPINLAVAAASPETVQV